MGARQLGHFGAPEPYSGFKQSRWKRWPHASAETRVVIGSMQMGHASGHTTTFAGEAMSKTPS